MNTKELNAALHAILAPSGFRRLKNTWYKTNEDTITLVNLQKSQWGGQYYVNLAVYLRDLGEAVSPPEYQSHIRTRLNSIAGADAAEIEEALDLERTSMSGEKRKSVLALALSNIALPFLIQRSTLTGLRKLLTEGKLAPALITKGAREFLETNSRSVL